MAVKCRHERLLDRLDCISSSVISKDFRLCALRLDNEHSQAQGKSFCLSLVTFLAWRSKSVLRLCIGSSTLGILEHTNINRHMALVWRRGF